MEMIVTDIPEEKELMFITAKINRRRMRRAE